jgi:hypothetical protein
MLQLSVKRLIFYITFFFYLTGCAIEEGDSGSSSSGFDVEEISNATTAVESTGKGTALVSWAPPTDNTDNSTLNDLAGFKIYYGTFPGEYDQTITINNPGLSSYLVENLASSDWFFVMTAFNTSGIESAYSAEVTKEIVEID